MYGRHVLHLVGHAARGLLGVVLACGLMSTTGCTLLGGGVTPVQVPADPPGIIGVIKSIDRSEQGDLWGALLVEGGQQPEGAASDKAMVTLTEKTLVAQADRWIPPNDLKVGMTVRVWFDGPVAESYPVQGSASFIAVDAGGGR